MTILAKRMIAHIQAHLAGRVRQPVPAGGALLWTWFTDLNHTRTMHAAGPNPICYQEIEAYARLHRIPVRPDHVEILCAMDRVYLDHIHAGRKTTPDGVAVLPPRSSSPMTGELFDALFG